VRKNTCKSAMRHKQDGSQDEAKPATHHAKVRHANLRRKLRIRVKTRMKPTHDTTPCSAFRRLRHSNRSVSDKDEADSRRQPITFSHGPVLPRPLHA
jgi:hypothetical protein